MDVSPHRFDAICMCMVCEEDKDFSLCKDECGPGDVTMETTPMARDNITVLYRGRKCKTTFPGASITP